MQDRSRVSIAANALLGAWRITQLLVGGEESEREEGDDKFLWFTESVIVSGDKWAAWHMPYSIKETSTPLKIDIQRDDLWEPWLQPGIVEVLGDTLRICAASSEGEPRPTRFGSTDHGGETLYVAERCDEPLPK
jgi:uncharacterized protein (TIGR03067 family)